MIQGDLNRSKFGKYKVQRPTISLGRTLVLLVSPPPLRFRVQRSKVESIFRVVSSATFRKDAPVPELEDRLRRQLRAFDVIGVRRARNETMPPTFNRSSPGNRSVDDSIRSKEEEEEERRLFPHPFLLPSLLLSSR